MDDLIKQKIIAHIREKYKIRDDIKINIDHAFEENNAIEIYYFLIFEKKKNLHYEKIFKSSLGFHCGAERQSYEIHR